ncbi:hypothetical protein D3C73_1540560 [compost metagenome]
MVGGAGGLGDPRFRCQLFERYHLPRCQRVVTGNDHIQGIVEQNPLLEPWIVLNIGVGLHGDDHREVDSLGNQQVEAAGRVGLEDLYLQQGAS